MNNIKDLQLFLAVVEMESITQAAKQIGYTESGASHIIKRLEKAMGFALFTRGRKGLVLTPNGQRVLPHVRRIIQANELFIEETSAISGVLEGHISIGAYESAAIHWLPPALARFHRDFPNITVAINEWRSDEIEAGLEDGSIDFGITSQPQSRKMEWISLKTEPYMAVCAPNSPLAKELAFQLRRLEETVCILPYHTDPDLYQSLNPMEIRPKQVFSARNEFTMMALVAQNLGISILPELVLRGYQGDNVLLPLVPPIYRSLGILIPSVRDASPAARRFLQYLRETVDQIEGMLPPPCMLEYATRCGEC